MKDNDKLNTDEILNVISNQGKEQKNENEVWFTAPVDYNDRLSVTDCKLPPSPYSYLTDTVQYSELKINTQEVQDITMTFGENKMIFKTNGEIWFNDRLLVEDNEIVEAFRKFLQII